MLDWDSPEFEEPSEAESGGVSILELNEQVLKRDLAGKERVKTGTQTERSSISCCKMNIIEFTS